MKHRTKLLYMIAVLLCFASLQIFAQDELPFGPPTQPLIACQSDTSDPLICDVIATQAEDIAGIWAVYFNAELAFVRFNADGTWWMAATADTINEASPDYPSGTFSIDENSVLTTSDPTLVEIPDLEAECADGQYLARVIKMGDQPVALNLAVLNDCFPPRRTDYSYTMLWVSE